VDSGSLFYFLDHCGIGFFLDHSISHIINSRSVPYLAKWLTTTDIRIRIRINPKIWIRIPNHFWLKFWRWRRFALSLRHAYTVGTATQWSKRCRRRGKCWRHEDGGAAGAEWVRFEQAYRIPSQPTTGSVVQPLSLAIFHAFYLQFRLVLSLFVGDVEIWIRVLQNARNRWNCK